MTARGRLFRSEYLGFVQAPAPDATHAYLETGQAFGKVVLTT